MENIYGVHKLVGLQLFLSGTPTFSSGTPTFCQMGVLNSCFQNPSESSDTVSAGLKFTSDILSKQPKYCSDIWKFLGHFFNTHFYHHKRKLPSALLKLKPEVVLLPFRMVSAA